MNLSSLLFGVQFNGDSLLFVMKYRVEPGLTILMVL